MKTKYVDFVTGYNVIGLLQMTNYSKNIFSKQYALFSYNAASILAKQSFFLITRSAVTNNVALRHNTEEDAEDTMLRHTREQQSGTGGILQQRMNRLKEHDN